MTRETVEVYQPHSLVIVETFDGDTTDACACQVRKADDSIEDGRVPADLPDKDEDCPNRLLRY